MTVGTRKKWRVPKVLIVFLLSALQEEKQSRTEYAGEDYTVRRQEKLGVVAERDCFASERNTRCEKFFSRRENALTEIWNPGEVLWINPPWTLWPRVVKKLLKTKCTAICICPDWERKWVKTLFRMATKKFRFEEGTHLFEANGKPMEGIRWGVWALLIEGGSTAKNNVENIFSEECENSGIEDYTSEINVVKIKPRMLRDIYPVRGYRTIKKGSAAFGSYSGGTNEWGRNFAAYLD